MAEATIMGKKMFKYAPSGSENEKSWATLLWSKVLQSVPQTFILVPRSQFSMGNQHFDTNTQVKPSRREGHKDRNTHTKDSRGNRK